MPSQLIYQDRIPLTPAAFAQLVIWRVVPPVRASGHCYKYRFAYVKDGICRLRYDNEAGKGDHKHIDGKEEPLNFTTIDALLDSFWREVMQLTEES
ncbi:toxin-antitoxin system TumE family protein [Serratia ureilytica]|uniref:toxin-antitoxin system TumE family protein n=1 Tax=Serratia ureilytica TaxID=300181 RepID=UPI0018D89639|nr:DUF6516 family protein [Serratia ureilytica]MBH2617476.1 hypothetical protein [Serratia ureilytica]